MSEIAVLRRHYAEGVCMGLRHESALVEAYAQVDREAYLLPPPWFVLTQKPGRSVGACQTSNPRDLYHDVLVQLNPARRINNGQPSLWAAVLDCLLGHGPRDVLHLGCGSGYYTAVMAALMPRASLRFFDANEPLQQHTTAAFAEQRRVEPDDHQSDVDAIVCSFGRSVIPAALLSRWRDGGVILTPVTDGQGRGFFVEITRARNEVTCKALFRCYFILDYEQHTWPDRVTWREPFSIALPKLGALDLGAAFAPDI